ncbi:MAG: radical SAM protein [Limisphaerales bacterium]
MLNASASKEIAEYRGIKPSAGWLTVNRECNMRCEFCYAKGTNYEPSENMSIQTALSLMSAMQSVGVTNVTLIGGEPTLWNPLFEFISEAKRVGMKTTLVTNATRLGNDSFWNIYRENHCTKTSLSIKAFNEESYLCVTGHSNFQITKTGISRALELDSTRATVVYTGEKPEEIVALARFAASCGAKSLGISPATPIYVGGKPESEFLIHPELFVRGIVEHYDELDQIFDGKFSLSVKLPLCMWPRNLIKKMMERSQIYTGWRVSERLCAGHRNERKSYD